MSIQVRRARPAEAIALGAFAAELFREAYGPTHPEPVLSTYLEECFGGDAMAHRLGDPERTFLVVESTDASQWLAYAELRVGSPDPARVTVERPLPRARALEIVRFYVAARYHGRGIAQALMRACEAQASDAGCDVLWLQAWQEASQAVSFYRKEGFAVHGTAVFLFGERVDHDYLMVKVVAAAASRRHAAG